METFLKPKVVSEMIIALFSPDIPDDYKLKLMEPHLTSFTASDGIIKFRWLTREEYYNYIWSKLRGNIIYGINYGEEMKKFRVINCGIYNKNMRKVFPFDSVIWKGIYLYVSDGILCEDVIDMDDIIENDK